MAKSFIAACIMAAILVIAQVPIYCEFFLPFYVLLGLIVYIAMLRVLKAISRKQPEIDLARSYLGDRLQFVTNLRANSTVSNR